MAEYILDVMSQTSKLDWAFPFQRTGAFPIDRSAVFSSLADAQNYALGVNEGEEAKDERKLGGTSYVGQIISVYEAPEGEDGVASVNAYIITPTRQLLKLAATTVSGDIVTDVTNLQEEVNVVIQNITNIEEAVETKAELEYVDEELAKRALESDLETEIARAEAAEKANADAILLKADKTYVDEELAKKAVKSEVEDALALKANSEDVYTKEETYTKTEIETYVNNQIGSAGHLSRSIVEALPEVSEADVDTIYMLKKSGGLIGQDHYQEYMVINGAWELIGDTYVDLTDYATKEHVAAEIDVIEGALALKANQSNLDATNEQVALKADKTYVDDELAKKADKTQVESDIANAIAPLAIKAEVEQALALKADKTELEALADIVNENRTELEEAIALKADKTYVDEELAKKADKATTLAGYNIADAYTKDEVDAALLLKASQQDHNALVDVVNGKADKADSLEGYGILDAYTKDEVDEKFAEKATTLAGYGITDAYTKGETYTRTEISDLIADITGGESAADVLAALNAYKGSNDERVTNAENRIKALEDAGADDNIIEAIKIAGESSALEIVEKTVTLPAATSEKLGLVKLSAEVGVDVTGALEVKSLNVNKLNQTQGEWLILNGGTAAI